MSEAGSRAPRGPALGFRLIRLRAIGLDMSLKDSN